MKVLRKKRKLMFKAAGRLHKVRTEKCLFKYIVVIGNIIESYFGEDYHG